MPKFQAKYNIDDGFVTGRRQNVFSISSDELWPGMTERDIEDLFHIEMQRDFSNQVYPIPANLEEFTKWAHEMVATEVLDG